MNILLAVDGSEASLRATHHAIAVALGEGERPIHHLVLVNVQEPVTAPEVLGHMPAREIEAMQQSRGGDALAQARERIVAAGVPHTVNVVVGDVAESLASQAEQTRCALIVMGTRAHGPLRSVLIGSTAAAVLERTLLPVTLVK